MRTPTIFHADQFTPTQWDTSEQKARFANQFVKFVKGGFETQDFPKWFYERLSNTFGHIAHYNQSGFYDTFFLTWEGKMDFIDMTVNYPGYGDPTFTYSDVEKEIQRWLLESGIPQKVEAERNGDIEQRERAELSRLSAKYPDFGVEHIRKE